MDRPRLPALARCVTWLVLTGAATTWAQADGPSAWKWRDSSGRVTMSDMPPPGSVPERDILARPNALPTRPRAVAAPAAASAAPLATAALNPRIDPELEARRKKAIEDQQAQQRAQDGKDAAARAENCSRAKGQLAALADGQRMTRTNAQGEREVLDDKGRADEMQRARAIIASDCR